MKNNAIVIGLGYVGLPVAIAVAKSGSSVIGIDLNTEKVNSINKGLSPVEDIRDSEIQDLISTGLFRASTDYAEIRNANVVLICVPTPLLENQLPDLSMVENAARRMGEYLTKDTLVILESTVAPGTTRNFWRRANARSTKGNHPTTNRGTPF